jgi:hypothetical protein
VEPHGSGRGALNAPRSSPGGSAWRFWWRGWATHRATTLDAPAAAQALGQSVRGSGYLQRLEGEVFCGFVNPRLLFIEHRLGRWHADGAFNPVFLGRLREPRPHDPPGTMSVLEGRYTFRASLKVAVMLGLLIAASLIAGPLAGTVTPRLPGAAPDRTAAWLMAGLALVALLLLLATLRAAIAAGRARVAAIEAMIAQRLPSPALAPAAPADAAGPLSPPQERNDER